MAAINFGSTVSLEQAAQLIATVKSNRFYIKGEPGIGKSALLEMLRRMLADYKCVYRDVSTMDLGDVGYPAMDHEAKVSRLYPMAGWCITEGKPVCIMLDEFTKGADPVKNMLHPLLEVNNPRLGDVSLPEGSIVFMTGNLTSDGVGDTLKAHTKSRITTLHVKKPDSEQWLRWAVSSGKIDPVVMAWVDRFPHALASYTDDGQSENPYIYQPKKMQDSYVTPRSLELASNIISKRTEFDDASLIAALIGTLGEAAARDIQAFIAFQDQLPSWDSIIGEPKHARIPDSSGACAVLVFGAVTKVDRNNIDQFMVYLDRLAPEWQAAFCITIARDPAKQAIAFSNKSFAKWVLANEDII
jgi:hypothetical protein